MAFTLIQNATTGTPLLFFMVQSSDHITGLTGASPTVTISKNGGAFGSPSGAVTEIANGWYKVAGNATDTNTNGPIALHATAASGDPTDCVPAEVVGFDPTQTNLAANVIQWNSTNVATPATAGIPDVNIKNFNNVSASSVTTVNANQGTTQPVNFTGTGGSADVNAAPDWAHVLNQTSTVGLTNTTISGGGGGAPTAAQVATAVWQDTTAGDFTVASSIGKSLAPATLGTAPGAAGGFLIAGINAATTFATLTSTGAFTINGTSDVAQTGDSFARIGSTGSGLTSLAPSTLLTTAMTESYSTLGGTKTPVQALYELCSIFENSTLSGTTLNTYKVDGATVAMTFNLNSATNPTSRLRAT